MAPLVSVIVPAYNAESHVQGAIESVLAQDFEDWELIVVDDGSTDATTDTIERFGGRVRCERIAHAGANRARNHGLLASRGELLALLDADDRWLPGKLRAQVDAMAKDPEAGACFVRTRDIDEVNDRSWDRPWMEHRDVVAALLLHSSILGPTSALMVRREVMFDVGLFDESLTQSQDYDLCLRLARATRFLLLPDLLVLYRMHGGNMTRNVGRFEANALIILGRFFAEEENRRRWGHLRRASYSNHFWMFAGAYAESGNWPRFAKNLARSLLWNPAKLTSIPPTLRKRLAQRGAGPAPPARNQAHRIPGGTVQDAAKRL